MPSISDPIISIKGLGKKTSDRLNQLGIHTLEHLVFHLPKRYQDKTSITPLSNANINAEILVELNIDRIEVVPSRNRQLLCYLSDNQNQRLLLRFFHFTQYQKQGNYTVFWGSQNGPSRPRNASSRISHCFTKSNPSLRANPHPNLPSMLRS